MLGTVIVGAGGAWRDVGTAEGESWKATVQMVGSTAHSTQQAAVQELEDSRGKQTQSPGERRRYTQGGGGVGAGRAGAVRAV